MIHLIDGRYGVSKAYPDADCGEPRAVDFGM